MLRNEKRGDIYFSPWKPDISLSADFPQINFNYEVKAQ